LAFCTTILSSQHIIEIFRATLRSFRKKNCGSMWDTVTIRLAASVVLHPSLSGLQKWLPDVAHNLGFGRTFDSRRLITQMAEAFSKRLQYPITPDTIVTTLEQFIGYLAPKSNFAASTGTRLDGHMKDCLRKDLGVIETSDLRRSRQRFLIFCLVARNTQSQALATSMVGFLQGHLHEVVYDEQPGMRREWYMGLSALEGLVSERVLEQLLRCFSGTVGLSYEMRRQPACYDPCAAMMMKRPHYPFFGHQGGRMPLRLEDPRDRWLSVGRPHRHRHRHHFPPNAYPWIQRNGHFDDVGRLQYQQERIFSKLNHIGEKLDDLS